MKRGVGVAQAVWYRINSMDSGCEVRIRQDGSVEALSAVQDIGGGIKTVIAQVVAEELGLNHVTSRCASATRSCRRARPRAEA